jgi:hypothetical protein
MTKPDDIDQDTWEKAWSIVSDIQMKDIKDGLPTGWEVFASIDRIARAIMSERAKEREACAKIAEDDDGALPGWGEHRNMVVAQQVGKDIAAAIRNRP